MAVKKGQGSRALPHLKWALPRATFTAKKKKRKEKKIELKQLSNCLTAHLFIAYYNLYPATWNLIVTALSNDTVSQDTKIKEELKMITMTTTTIGPKIFRVMCRVHWTEISFLSFIVTTKLKSHTQVKRKVAAQHSANTPAGMVLDETVNDFSHLAKITSCSSLLVCGKNIRMISFCFWPASGLSRTHTCTYNYVYIYICIVGLHP